MTKIKHTRGGTVQHSTFILTFSQEGEYTNILPTDEQRPHNKVGCHENNNSIIDQRKKNSSNALLMHLNKNNI